VFGVLCSDLSHNRLNGSTVAAFDNLGQDVLLPGSFTSVDALTTAIWNYLAGVQP
jgi:hypothetical protein